VTLNDDEADGSSYLPALSADGQLIVFRSHASNLVTDDTNFMGDIFLRDYLNGELKRVNVNSDGEEALGGPSDEPAISEDGLFVVFRSYATNLVSDDTNGKGDIFVRDLEGGTTRRASVDSYGLESNGSNYSPVINADGAAIAFYSVAYNLVLLDENNVGDVFGHGQPPTAEPTDTPTATPTDTPTTTPTDTPTTEPTDTPVAGPTDTPTPTPTDTPPAEPTDTPTTTPEDTPAAEPTDTPTSTPEDTPAAEPTDTSTATPEDTPAAEPTETPTTTPEDTPTDTPTAEPTTEPPDPTEPPEFCSWVMDFETDASGEQLSRGQIIDDEWALFGIHVTTNDPNKHPAMIFDSAQPTGFDPDLGSPNEDFGGPGQGSGGKEGQPGENRWPLGKILIISEDGDQDDPDDNYAGGTLIFTFEIPAKVHEIQLIDIDNHETAGKIVAYGQNGKKLGAFSIQPVGNNGVQIVTINLENVTKLDIYFENSGAVAALSFCD
jgi:hypothetical protein